MRLLILGFLILFVASSSCHQVPPVSSQLLGLFVNESYGERSEQLVDFQESLGDFLNSFHSRKNGFNFDMLNQLSSYKLLFMRRILFCFRFLVVAFKYLKLPALLIWLFHFLISSSSNCLRRRKYFVKS